MNFFENLASFFKKLFMGGGSSQERFYTYRVKCKRCGEIIEGRIDTTNDLSVEYEGDREIYYVRKVLMGDGDTRCYQKIEVGLKFNKERELLEKVVENGEFVEA
jgi:hypothetical protein